MKNHDFALLPTAFRLRRLALAPARPDLSAETLGNAIALALDEGEATFTAFLIDNGLGPLWHQALHSHALQDRVSAVALDALRLSRFAAAAQYLSQNAALRQIDQLFESQGIAYAATKGSHIREMVYADPSLRPACDIDILVSAGQRVAAAEALVGAGFQYHPEPDTVSHEASFAKGKVHIDLHWNIFRPGRTRFDMTDSLIARRSRIDGFWGLGDTDAAFLMLTHPMFVKYVCSPAMAVCCVADFILWTERRGVDWDALATRLREAGLQTAAWTVLRWFAMLGVAAPEAFVAQVKPGEARARYLNYWLEHDLPTKWLSRRPLLIQLGMTLPAHDRPADAWRAMRGWLRAYIGRHDDPFAHLRGNLCL